jgi:DNA-directed RNA polymerase specialized sigma24 family protein
MAEGESADQGSISLDLERLRALESEQDWREARNRLWQRGKKIVEPLVRKVLSCGRRPEEGDVQDVANGACIKLFEKYFDTRAEEGRETSRLVKREQFTGLLRRIARNLALNWKRDSRRTPYTSEELPQVPDEAEDTRLALESSEEMLAFLDFVCEVADDPVVWQVADKIHSGSYEPEDKAAIAEALGVSVATVYRKIHILRALWRRFEARRGGGCAGGRPPGQRCCGRGATGPAGPVLEVIEGGHGKR